MARKTRLKLPATVTAQLTLSPGERALAWALGRSGEWYVGTNSALYLDAGATWRRLRWEAIERAEWQRDRDTLALVELIGWGEPEIRTELRLVDPGQLLELLRERVTKSVAVTVYAAVRGRLGLSVVGRRSPTGSGDVQWFYVLAEGLDPDDPEVAVVAARTLQEAQSEVAGL